MQTHHKVLVGTAALIAATAGAAMAAPSGPESPSNCTFSNGATTCSQVGDPVLSQSTSTPAAGCTTTTTTSTVTTTYTSHRGTYNSNGKALDTPASTSTATSSDQTSCSPTRYEAEDLLATGTFDNGFGYVQPDSRASGGAYDVFRMSLGSTFTASVTVPVTGTYDLTSADAQYPDTAIYTLSVDGTTVGSPTDTVGTGTINPTDHGTIHLTAGTHQLTETVTGTNSPYGYTVAPDYYEFSLIG